MRSYMISFMEITWMLCLFSSPAYIACNIGYLIPSSQTPVSPSLSEEPATDSDSSAQSPLSCHGAALDRSASRDRKYCRWPSRECARRTVRYTSLLSAQSARRLQLSISSENRGVLILSKLCCVLNSKYV